MVASIANLPALAPSSGDPTVVNQLGCAACHVARLGDVPLYSELLASRSWLLHDGRARSVEAAILAHGGEADATVQRFRGLSEADHGALLAFLSTL